MYHNSTYVLKVSKNHCGDVYKLIKKIMLENMSLARTKSLVDNVTIGRLCWPCKTLIC